MDLFLLLSSATSIADSASNGGQSTGTSSNPIFTFVLYGVIILMFIFLFTSNSKKRRKQQEEMQERLNSMKPGDTIKTIGMIVGTIKEICQDGSIVLETGSEEFKSYIRIDQQAIYQYTKAEEVEPFSELSEEVEVSENEVINQEEVVSENSESEVVNEVDEEVVNEEVVNEVNEEVADEEKEEKPADGE